MKFYLVFIICFTTTFGICQSTITCSYYGESAMFSNKEICDNSTFKSNDRIEKMADLILKTMGLERNFIIVECPNINNCVAINLPDKAGFLRYIIYDNLFLDQLEVKSGSYWSTISILSHEIGHHLQGHILDGIGSRPLKELEADKFSGFILGKLGAKLTDAKLAINLLQTGIKSLTHPSKSERLNAITEGWEDAKSVDYSITQKVVDLPKPKIVRSERIKYKNDFISVTYGAPAKKGRNIFGDLIKYNQIWRTGANEASEVSFLKNVNISGKKIVAGTYTIFSIPRERKWTIILNPNLNQWGSYGYEKIKEDNVLEVEVLAEKTVNISETMSITFESGFLVIKWDNTVVKLAVLEEQ